MDDLDERVRQRAYRLWVEEGCPDGRSDVHWEKARELVATEENQGLATKPVPRDNEATSEPVEPIEAVRNAGEFPILTDQGEQTAPSRRRAAAAQAAPAKRTAPAGSKAPAPKPQPPSAPKAKDTGAKRR